MGDIYAKVPVECLDYYISCISWNCTYSFHEIPMFCRDDHLKLPLGLELLIAWEEIAIAFPRDRWASWEASWEGWLSSHPAQVQLLWEMPSEECCKQNGRIKQQSCYSWWICLCSQPLKQTDGLSHTEHRVKVNKEQERAHWRCWMEPEDSLLMGKWKHMVLKYGFETVISFAYSDYPFPTIFFGQITYLFWASVLVL